MFEDQQYFLKRQKKSVFLLWTFAEENKSIQTLSNCCESGRLSWCATHVGVNTNMLCLPPKQTARSVTTGELDGDESDEDGGHTGYKAR